MPNTLENDEIPFAAIDLGSNSAHLVIASMKSAGQLQILETDKTQLRLGEAIDENGNITADGIARTTAAFVQMMEIAESYNADVRAVATHATRVANNHYELLNSIKRATGLKVEIIDGIEEARLAFLGMRHGLVINGEKCLGIDIGGGSTEAIIAKDEVNDYIASYSLGAVNLTKQFLHTNRDKESIENLIQYVKAKLAPIHRSAVSIEFTKAIATSGTAKALAHVHSKLILGQKLEDANGYEIPDADLRKITTMLIDFAETEVIMKGTGLEKSRAEIIIAGAIILSEISKIFGIFKWTITTYGLREGLVADSFRRTSGLSELPDVQWHSVQSFAKRCGLRGSHHAHVSTLALQLFDKTADSYIQQDDLVQNRSILKYASYLHEVGKFISEQQYHKHSMYLITNSRVPGFMERERKLMGLIARFHRKRPATVKSPHCKNLSPKRLGYLQYLSGILRLASSLDRSRKQKVTSLDVNNHKDQVCVRAFLTPDTKAFVERYKVEVELENIAESFGRPVEVDFVSEDSSGS